MNDVDGLEPVRLGEMNESQRDGRRPIPLVYLVAPGHSGSTLLALLLGAHPAIATVGELKVVAGSFAVGAVCSCGMRIDVCPFWRAVVARLARDEGMKLSQNPAKTGQRPVPQKFWDNFMRPGHSDVVTHARPDADFVTHARPGGERWDRLVAGQVRGPMLEAVRGAALRIWPAARRRWRRMLDCNLALARAILEVTGRPLLLDTSKDASRLRYLHESGRFDVRVLHLLRDGRAVAHSLIRKGLDPAAAAREWVGEHAQAQRLRRRFRPERWLTVRYETLCAQPAAQLDAVCDFLAIERRADLLDFRAWDSHVLGNRMRLEHGGVIACDESWRAELGREARRVVERIVAPLNRVFGYRDEAVP